MLDHPLGFFIPGLGFFITNSGLLLHLDQLYELEHLSLVNLNHLGRLCCLVRF